jgi:hypothetical protein
MKKSHESLAAGTRKPLLTKERVRNLVIKTGMKAGGRSEQIVRHGKPGPDICW